jgi:hypothetical protein
MHQDILDRIERDFATEDKATVIQELSSIDLTHVMAASETNLHNTRMAILHLANGNVKEVTDLTRQAKIDFRDVIYWATMKNQG